MVNTRVNRFIAGMLSFLERYYVIEIVLFLLFIWVRSLSVINKTFPYTYDQGRDMLKVEEVVRYKNPTFIGPTTGIMGIYHGAWWYYFLAIPYILFNGKAIGFAWFLVFIAFIQTLFFYIFLKNIFKRSIASLFLVFVTFSPYFINISSFITNTSLVLPFLLLLLYSTIKYLKTKKEIFLFLVFLSLGFVFESEFAFGLFIIPAFVISIILVGKFKEFFWSWRRVVSVFSGLFLALILRIMFELKHNFIQTRTFINFIFKPKLFNPKPLRDRIIDRVILFKGYYLSIFLDHYQVVFGMVFLIISVIGIYRNYKKLASSVRKSLLITLSTILFLFIFSILYKDNFWGNYYEGIQYLFIFPILFGTYCFMKQGKHYKYIMELILLFYILIGITRFAYLIKRPVKETGFRVQEKVVKFLLSKVSPKQDFCVKIYTPPVIPYTYNYLFSYYARTHGYNFPKDEFVKGQCFYVIEYDKWRFRVKKWRRENIPPKTHLVKKYNVVKNVVVEQWRK